MQSLQDTLPGMQHAQLISGGKVVVKSDLAVRQPLCPTGGTRSGRNSCGTPRWRRIKKKDRRSGLGIYRSVSRPLSLPLNRLLKELLGHLVNWGS